MTIVQTKKGKVQGVAMDGYTVFKGIPYAKPPVGDLRWKEPQECDPWNGVLQADHFPNMCPQDKFSNINPFMSFFLREFYNDPAFLPPMSEDCLYLNVWVPEHEPGKKLPVAFWIHGGGFGSGCGNEKEFDGEAYCRRGVILVTINYRLNVFGYFAHPWLTAENEHGSSGNYGSLDQVAALKWVRDNIAAFDGDPGKVTIFGQSAGCMSCQVLVSSEMTKDLFSGTIFQSGLVCESDFLLTPTLSEAEEFGKVFVDFTGAKNLEELRALSVEQLMEARAKFNALGKGIVHVPNVDGYLLKQNVKEAWKNGDFTKIPYMVGYCSKDLGRRPDAAEDALPILADEAVSWSLRCEQLGLPSYIYHFAHRLPDEDGKTIPPFHSAELWYTFATYGRCWRPMTEEDAKLSNHVLDNWTSFMKSGAPADSDWLPCVKDNEYVKVF